MSVKDILIKNYTVQIQKGDSNIWSTRCTIWNEIHNHLNLPVTVQGLPNTISDLWTPGTTSWNSNLINQIFDAEAGDLIQKNFPIPSTNEDAIK
jgi:hypothetical protein